MTMSKQQLGHLVKMANDIARNMAGWGDQQTVARKTAEHMTKSWTPAMRTQLVAFWLGGGEGLSAAAAEALAILDKAAQQREIT